MDEDNLLRMREYFDIIEESGFRKFFCKGCNKGWQLPESSLHPGSYLKMLDHAFCHREIRREEESSR